MFHVVFLKKTFNADRDRLLLIRFWHYVFFFAAIGFSKIVIMMSIYEFLTRDLNLFVPFYRSYLYNASFE